MRIPFLGSLLGSITPSAIRSFLERSAVSGVLAALAYAISNVQSLGTSADNAALIVFVLSYVVHAVHAFASRAGVDPSVSPDPGPTPPPEPPAPTA